MKACVHHKISMHKDSQAQVADQLIIAAPLSTVVSGTYNISATYCKPIKTNATLYNTLQILVYWWAFS
jgi:hypothetical protein